MKKLKFDDNQIQLILDGKKNTTWRCFDDKDLKKGDKVSFCNKDGKEFSKANIISVKKTAFRNLSREDKEGYEPFNSDRDMLITFGNYYKKELEFDTELKVIKFEIIKEESQNPRSIRHFLFRRQERTILSS